MAITYTDNGGGAPNGSDKEFTYTFPVIQTEDVKVALNGVTQATTKYAVDNVSNPTKITFNNTSVDSSVQETSGAPKSGVTVRVYRETTVGKANGDEDPKAVFAAGSSIRATDLNANQEQALFAIHELQSQPVLAEQIDTGAITSDKILDGTIATADIADSAITTAKINADAVNGTKIADDSINSEHYVAGSIDEEHLANSAVSQNKLASNSVGTSQLINGSVNSDKILDGTIVNADVNASAAIAGTKISPDFGSQNIATTGTINNVTTTELGILDGATVTTNELNILDGVTSTASELNILDGVTATTAELNYVDGVTSNVQTQLDAKQPLDAELTELATMASGTASALADLTQTEVQTIDGITATTAELNLNDGQTATPSEVNILDGATLNTNELNILDGVTASTTELNLLDGKSIITSISGNATDVQIPSAQAVNERVVELVTEVGGFVPIANETSFPATNPDINDGAGTIVSIKALSSAFTLGSGVTTKVFTNGAGSGVNVTVNGLTQSTTYPAGRGMLLETTSTLHTYNFHRLTLDETGVADAQAAIDDFDERYYGPLSSAPNTKPGGGSRANGDMYFDTSANKMKVFNASTSAWDDVATSASSFISTLSPAFDGNETEFTASNVPIDAQSAIISINGVIQKPNSGTSTPSEGYVQLANDKIKFASPPASGANYFMITLGNAVSIGTPSDNTVTSAKIVDGTIVNADISSSAAIAKSKLASLDIVNADVNASAAIAGSKISPDFGSQNIVTTGSISGAAGTLTGDLTIPDTIVHTGDTNTKIRFPAADTFSVETAGSERVRIDSSGNVLIGTTTAAAGDLVIKDKTNAGNQVWIVGRANGDTASVSFRNNADNAYTGRIEVDSTDGMEFYTGSTERMRIDSSGRVLIGTTTEGNSDGDDLTVATSNNGGITIRTGTSSNGNLFFSDATSGTAEYAGYIQYKHSSDRLDFGTATSTRMTIDSSGNVGIGTTSPSQPLHVEESTVNKGLLAYNTNTTSNASVPLFLASESGGSTTNISIENAGAGDLAIRTGATTKDGYGSERMRITSAGDVEIMQDKKLIFVYAGGSTHRASITADATDAMKFTTGSSDTERMRIDSSGRLLIGVGSSAHASTDADDLCVGNNDSSSEHGITIGSNNAGSIRFSDSSSGSVGVFNYSHTYDQMTFYTAGTLRMMIDGSGNIGAPTGSNIYNASDLRLKKNVIDLDKGLSAIKSLRPVSFNWIDGFCDDEKDTLYGFIAQEVETIDSNLIQEFGDGSVTVKGKIINDALRVNEKLIIPVLVKAVQELEAKVAALEAA